MSKVYVVEGYHDLSRLKQVSPNLKVVVTNGSEISTDTMLYLVQLEETHQIVLLLDPDFPGDKIRHKLTSVLENPHHIFIPKELATSSTGKKIGIEHVSLKDLENFLDLEVVPSLNQSLTLADLIDLKLTGQRNSSVLREKVLKHYHLGNANTKTMLIRLSWLGVTFDDLEKVLVGFET